MGAPALAIGYAVGRLGCQLAGDGDYGIPSDLPWAMSYPDGTVPTTDQVHPTPIYEFLVMSAVTWWLWSRRDKVRHGELIGWWAVLAGIERFLVEFIRRNDDIVGPFSLAQFVSVLMIVVGTLVAAAGALPRAAASELDDAAEAARFRARQGEVSGGVVLEADADGLVERQLLGARAARLGAGHELAELRVRLRALEVGAAGGRRGERGLA